MKAAFFQPRPDAGGGPGWTSPARELRDALEPVAAVSFWSEPSSTAYGALGLDFLTGYVWSRASALGDADAAVAAAAFGVFDPAAVEGLLGAARAACSLEQIRRAREDGAAAALRQALGSADDVEPVVAALRRGAEAADTTGRPMFAGERGLPWPQDPHAALWHGATLLRECRGDSHLAACVAAGLTGLQATVLTELWVGYEPLAYTGTRAWSPDAMATAQRGLQTRGLVDEAGLTGDGRALRESVEQATDAAMAPVVEAVGEDRDLVVAKGNAWSEQLLARGWFPPDPYKRAAG